MQTSPTDPLTDGQQFQLRTSNGLRIQRFTQCAGDRPCGSSVFSFTNDVGTFEAQRFVPNTLGPEFEWLDCAVVECLVSAQTAEGVISGPLLFADNIDARPLPEFTAQSSDQLTIELTILGLDLAEVVVDLSGCLDDECRAAVDIRDVKSDGTKFTFELESAENLAACIAQDGCNFGIQTPNWQMWLPVAAVLR